ncbi:hypothetical protein FYK55_10905 [Roseiconus nitratireducens]|uniref:Uncharacterized protein n=1 Tax=Roseiconus nitratireducens TaxID=2605748 RepID=A0A5M6DB00_9BACT|nr:DUF6666 family protein [Roseiconus nitratireducens]KAA5543696.1 hypothetical protein FYK55_10905 [Roseiconus nitratireducens]
MSTSRNQTTRELTRRSTGMQRILNQTVPRRWTGSLLTVALAATAMLLSADAWAQPATGAPQRYAQDQIDLTGVRSLATSQRPVRNRVRQTSMLGPIQLEPACGCEGACDCPIGGFAEPGCGIEASCGIEATCGIDSWPTAATCDSCGTAGCDGIGCLTAGPIGCDGMDPSCGCDQCARPAARAIDCLFPRLRVHWNRYDFFAGVAGFTGPLNYASTSTDETNRVGAGSFGFYEGFNKGRSLAFFGTDLAFQYGARFSQANLSGTSFTDDTRQQVFVTSGFFRRVDYGLQYALAVDYLYDDWYYQADLNQLRGELSWVTRNRHVFGLQFAAGVNDDTSRTNVVDADGDTFSETLAIEAMNQYRLFYRQQLARCGSCEAFIGWTDNDDGLLGVDLDLPIHGNLLWNTSATYLIPNEGSTSGGFREEGWNLAIGFTYRPGGLGAQSRYNRPLLDVADNGLMMLDRK